MIVRTQAPKKKTDRQPETIYKKRAADKDFCSINDVPAHLIRILILIEDFSFFKHHGIQLKEIMGAM